MAKQDPRQAGQKPPFPEQQQEFPGSDEAMEPPFSPSGMPAEMAPLFVLLASQEGSYLTGEVFGATGGKMPY